MIMRTASHAFISGLAIIVVALAPCFASAETFGPPEQPRPDEPQTEPPKTEQPVDVAPTGTAVDEKPPEPEPANARPAESATSERVKAKEGATEANPCKAKKPTAREAWIDRVQNGVFQGVCGSAVWFDSFFGHRYTYEGSDLWGRLGLGALYKTNGEFDTRSRFDANIPLPNVNRRTSAFIGRDNANDYVTQSTEALTVPATFLRLSDEQSWLAGLGYSPSGRRGQHFNFRLGGKVSVDPYVFGQIRYRFDLYAGARSAFRLQETVFYRSSADGLGATTFLGYDWLPKDAYMLRLSTTGTRSQDTEGIKWNAFTTLYQDMTRPRGRVHGASYQLIATGETKKDVPIQEYGFLGVYRQQVFRKWMFADLTVGYTFPRQELTDKRKGAVNLGIVFDILFGNVPDALGRK